MTQVQNTSLPFNPSIFAWARNRAGLAIDEVAEKIKVKPEKISAWENGKISPTVRQGRNLAKCYKRPFLEFFAKSIPSIPDVELVPDFRFYNQTTSAQEKHALKAVQEWAENVRLNAIAIIDDLGEEPRKFSHNLKFSYKDDPSIAASTLRDAMGFNIEDQLHIPKGKKYKLPNILRGLIEDMGVIVLKQSSITKLNARGMCIYSDILPTIIYGGEAPSAQSFTIMHEFAHVVIGTSAISSGLSIGKDIPSQDAPIEKWCNHFAASFLMPESAIKNITSIPSSKVNEIDESWLRTTSGMFGVSPHSFLIRLIDLDLIDSDFYWSKMRPKFLKEESQYKSFGRAPYYGKRYISTNGRFYTNLVLDALGRGIVDAHNAANYLGIKNLQHLADIKAEARV